MKPRILLREALSAAWASKVSTALVMVVVAAMCLASVVTVGRQAATEQAVRERLSGPAALTLTITDTSGEGRLTGEVLAVLQTLSNMAAVVGTGAPVDVHNGQLPGGPSSALLPLAGTAGSALELTRGRMPGPGEAIVPESLLPLLRMEATSGYVESSDGAQWAVVGGFVAVEPFGDLDSQVLVASNTSTGISTEATSYRQIRAVADSVTSVRALQNAVLSILGPVDPTKVQIDSALTAASTSQDISDQLAGFGRSLLLLILGVGAFFVAVVVLADVLVRRRDLGRRRTLGITRGDLVGLVTLRTCVPAFIGALAGAGAGYAVVAGQSMSVPGDFTIAVAILGTLTAALACLPPAIYASRRDPVEVMRTP